MQERLQKQLLRKFSFKSGVSFTDFKKAFTHISIYEASGDTKNVGNSRYVFLGMYAFKGFVAEVLSDYIEGNGKQLQHYLGNLFSNDRLAKIYDELNLGLLITIHDSLDPNKIKHVFAYAFLGFMHKHATDDQRKAFVYDLILKDSEHLMPKIHRLHTIQILKSKAKQVLDQRIALRYFTNKEGEKTIYKTQIILTDSTIIGEHESVSQLYSKKKAIKLALKYVLDKEAESPTYQLFLEKEKSKDEQKKLREKAAKQKTHLERMQAKQVERAVIREVKKKEAKEREFRRALNKANAKKKDDSKSANGENTTFDKDFRKPKIN